MTDKELLNSIKIQNDELKKQLENRDNLLILLTKEIAQLKITINERIEKLDNKIDLFLKDK